MRIFTNLRLLQIIDSALLIILLGVIALLLWFSLSDVSHKAQQNQQQATVSHAGSLCSLPAAGRTGNTH